MLPVSPLAEWLIEQGIGEDRAILVDGSSIRAARIDWGGFMRPGTIIDGFLYSKPAGARRGLARVIDGSEVLVDGLPREATEGMTIRLRITRSRIAERGRDKLAQSRPAPAGAIERDGPSLLEELAGGPIPLRRVRPADGVFNDFGWDELVEEALSGAIAFAGGSIVISPTPAMTVIDVDGAMPPRALALAAVPAIAEALTRFDISGNIGIDFPTLSDKADRHAVDNALADALVDCADWRGERTAMNGFGFVQLVSRLERPSIMAQYQRFPAKAAAQLLLRRAEATEGPGKLLLCANRAIRAGMPLDWSAELRRRTGRDHEWHWDDGLALTSPYVQTVSA